MSNMSQRVGEDHQCLIIVCYMFYHFHFTKTPQLRKTHQHNEQGFLTGLVTAHVNAQLLPVHCSLKAVLSSTTLFNSIVTFWYLGKLKRFREASLEFKQRLS